jgi:hypothetical protein
LFTCITSSFFFFDPSPFPAILTFAGRPQLIISLHGVRISVFLCAQSNSNVN